jgi:hypothetical protein
MFLPPDVLAQLTEAKARNLQIAWLEKHRVPFTRGRKGGINVLTAYIERLHGLKEAVVPRNDEPNLDAFTPRRK